MSREAWEARRQEAHEAAQRELEALLEEEREAFEAGDLARLKRVLAKSKKVADDVHGSRNLNAWMHRLRQDPVRFQQVLDELGGTD